MDDDVDFVGLLFGMDANAILFLWFFRTLSGNWGWFQGQCSRVEEDASVVNGKEKIEIRDDIQQSSALSPAVCKGCSVGLGYSIDLSLDPELHTS